jgi:hypothetical protein
MAMSTARTPLGQFPEALRELLIPSARTTRDPVPAVRPSTSERGHPYGLAALRAEYAELAATPSPRSVSRASMTRPDAGPSQPQLPNTRALALTQADGLAGVGWHTARRGEVRARKGRVRAESGHRAVPRLAAGWRRGVRLVLARDVGQIRDMLAVTKGSGDAAASYRSVQQAVDAVRTGPDGGSAEKKD